jgi:hypothetical protein
VISDLVPRGGIRAVLVGGLALLAFAWLVLGLMVVVFFNPDTAPPVGPFS